MEPWRLAILLTLLVASCTSNGVGQKDVQQIDLGNDTDGFWVLSTLEIDGESIPVDEPLFLQIGNRFVDADTVCNSFSGEIGGPFSRTLIGCDPDLHRIEDLMIDAIMSGPRLVDDQLEFMTESARLVYDRDGSWTAFSATDG